MVNEVENPAETTQDSFNNHIFDLPFDAMTHVFSLLPLNANFSSSCVCKLWHNMSKEPNLSVLNPKPVFVSSCSALGCSKNRLGVIIGNSCDGLVCLCNKINGATVSIWDPKLKQIVYNLPTVLGFNSRYKGASSLGFRSKTKDNVWIRPDTWEADILTLGQKNWRRLGTLPCQLDCNNHMSLGTFFRGALHWIVRGRNSELICLVDIETEKLHPLPPPPGFFVSTPRGTWRLWSNLGIFNDHLYICATDDSLLTPDIEVWMMGNYGVKHVGWHIC